MDLSPQAIETLVAAAQKGDEESFEKLFEFYYPKLERFTAARVPAEEVEEVLSEIFLKLVSKLKTYQRKPENHFHAWIFRIARNTIIDFYRRKNTHQETPFSETEEEEIFHIADESLSPETYLQEKESIHQVSQWLERLKPSYREVLELKYLEGFSYKEIAQILQKTEGNIRIMHLRALRALKKKLLSS